MNQTIKRSPIHHAEEKWQGQFIEQAGWQVVQLFSSVEQETAVGQNSVALCDQSHKGKIRVEGKTAGAMLDADKLAINEGKATNVGWLYRLRQDLFFVSSSAESVADTSALSAVEVAVSLIQQANNSPDLITVTDVTHGNAELWLIGPHSAELLSRLCGLDFHDSRFPNCTAKQSSVAKTTQLIIRCDLGKQPAYALIGPRSLAAYLWQTILEAGQDLDIQPIGVAALRPLTTA
ncbi:MAG: aminomethyl transferase family protein [Chloroflexi bacterium]|nr:aminomethyl transferase family protein [Chloroflexota bacterium]